MGRVFAAVQKILEMLRCGMYVGVSTRYAGMTRHGNLKEHDDGC